MIQETNSVIEGADILPFPPKATIKLDLGCGNNKQPGFMGVDFMKDGTEADIQHDLNIYPWPFEDNSIAEIFSSHYFEHVDGIDRGRFMDEVYRILVPGGKATFITPFGWSSRAFQDFTHKFPPLVPESYLYFMKKWREVQNLKHGFYDLKCDFDMASVRYVVNEEMRSKERSLLDYDLKHSIGIADDLIVELKKI